MEKPKGNNMKKADIVVNDYDVTLQEFFNDVLEFLDNQAAYVDGELGYQRICKEREKVKKIAANPKKYASYDVRIIDNVDLDPRSFMSKRGDNSVYSAVNMVLNNIRNLDSETDCFRKGAQEVLLWARRQVQYKLSKKLFKDIQLAFKPDSGFAVKKQRTR